LFVTADSLNFRGLRVAAFESRMAEEMTRLIQRYGGDPLVTPALREIPLEDHHSVFDFGRRLLKGEFDMIILLTGVGVRYLVEVLETRHARNSIKEALGRIALVVRGPKPAAALKELGLTANISVPEPNTWRELLQVLDQHRNLKALRIAVQEYGSSNLDLLEALRGRGAEVTPVSIYRWSLPEDIRPLKAALGRIMAGEVDVLLITNAAQVDHIIQVLSPTNEIARFRDALKRVVVGSIGPTASEYLRRHNLPIDLEPSHPKMGTLAKEVSEQAAAILRKKRSR